MEEAIVAGKQSYPEDETGLFKLWFYVIPMYFFKLLGLVIRSFTIRLPKRINLWLVNRRIAKLRFNEGR